ncbi:putative aminotransferase [Leishmania major strain Friedlin]|uniref:cysteine desulfurase n=1 Tax=Leishmania major TaxID=5664 RepID=E9AFA8_LEIMA|nr:putative aminotransferase [Leishmania major strain Friedlin]CAG9582637.1 aminotransferase_-_putative [Leishmania major strain Friedlin]CBZ12912.1 putative aminotransferase [Leishmania major strain Friedlin]|eukprot:XP_003722678.1 putative aminotransferase [Leishmania major strain Friedlin]
MCNAHGPPLKKRKPQPLPPTASLPIYLDYNATTPLCEEAWQEICRVRKAWGNPSSTHPYGLAAKYELEEARKKVQKALHALSSESIIFTSGGTESNNLAIIGGLLALRQRQPSRRYVVSSNVEHPAVAEVLKSIAGSDLGTGGAASITDGAEAASGTTIETVRAEVNPQTGRLDASTLRAILESLPGGPESVALVSIMFANNEIGAVNDIKELCRVTKELCGAACLFHSDGAQALGKVPVDVQDTNVDLLSVCGHKFHGPKGVGALYIKPGVTVHNILFGAGHERSIRPGTENVLLAAGIAEALLFACNNMDRFSTVMRDTRDELLRVLTVELAAYDMGLVVNGAIAVTLPNTLNCALFRRVPNRKTGSPVTYISAQRLILSAADEVCISAGSACHSTAEGAEILVSDPLKAVQANADRAIGTLRISTGRTTTMDEVRRAGRIIARRAAQQFEEC